MTALPKPDFRRAERAASRLDQGLRQPIDETPRESRAEVILRQGSALTPEPVSWLWQHWLARGKLHVLAGPPGQGKTTIALAFAAICSASGRWPDGSKCAGGNVLVWSGEDDPADTLVPRLIAMGADTSRVHFIEGTRIGDKCLPFDPARDMQRLAESAAQIGNTAMLVIDPIVSAVSGDSHNNGDVRRDLQPVVDLAARLNAAAIGISHFTKGSGGKDPVERVTGSLAFGALARVVLCAVKVKAEDDGERRILARAKSNIGPDNGGFEYGIQQSELADHPGVEASRIVWGEPLCGTARELLAEAETDPTHDDEGPGDVAHWLAELLRRGPMASRQVRQFADEAGYSWRTTQRAMKRAGVDSRRAGFGGGTEWYLKGSGATVAPSAPLPSAGANGANGADDADSERF